MYAATGGPNVKWGAPISNGGAGHHWFPRWRWPWCPHVRTWSLSEANLLLKKVHVTLLGLFGASRSDSVPPQWFGARGIAPPLSPSLRLCIFIHSSRLAGILIHQCWQQTATLSLHISIRTTKRSEVLHMSKICDVDEIQPGSGLHHLVK